jgi:hypothetical protein
MINKRVGRRHAWGCRFIICHLTFGICLLCGAHDAPLNPDDPAYLRRQHAWFQAQPPQRQQQLRKLHEDFLALDERDQSRLTKVMQGYNAWLAKLPPADRERVLSAPSPGERLEVVRQLREREWVESLPRPYRDEYVRIDEAARRAKVEEWRAEEADRREESILALRHLTETQGKVPPGFAPEARGQLDLYVGRLKENLSEAERVVLDDARAAADEYGNYFWYARELLRLSELHPILPGQVGAKDFDSLPEAVKKYLVQNGFPVRKKGPETRDLRRAVGRWPEFALEVVRYCQRHNLKLPAPLGDCRKEDMPADVRDYLTRTLEPVLKRSADGRADLKALDEAQGKWPDFPKLVVDLAKKYKQPIPGWTLPAAWDRFRAAKNRPK